MLITHIVGEVNLGTEFDFHGYKVAIIYNNNPTLIKAMKKEKCLHLRDFRDKKKSSSDHVEMTKSSLETYMDVFKTLV